MNNAESRSRKQFSALLCYRNWERVKLFCSFKISIYSWYFLIDRMLTNSIHNIDLLEHMFDMLKIDEYLPSINCVSCADMYILLQLSTLELLSAHLIVRCAVVTRNALQLRHKLTFVHWI
jgi:hypothetical protein